MSLRNFEQPSFKDIADGASFDPVNTIRMLCEYMTDAHPSATTDRLTHRAQWAPEPELATLPPRLVELLAVHGYRTADDLRNADDSDLLAIDGIATKSLRLIRDALKPRASTPPRN